MGRYSESDERRRTEDRLADLRAKGIDARQIKSLVPGGTDAALKHLEQNISQVRDQSQEQTARNKEKFLKKKS